MERVQISYYGGMECSPEPEATGERDKNSGFLGAVSLHDPWGVRPHWKRKRPLSLAVWSDQPASTTVVRPPFTRFHVAITKQRHGAACTRGDRSPFKAVVHEIRSTECETHPGAKPDCGVEGMVRRST